MRTESTSGTECPATPVDAQRFPHRSNEPRPHGATVWLTGLSGAGKTTLAAAVGDALLAQGRWVYRLDGDLLRTGLCRDLGFSPADRSEHARRVAEVARLLADAGAIALVALISPFAADRARARDLHEQAGFAFIEVYVATSLAECARRDPKGLYRQAAAGTLTDLSGIGAAYETPSTPDVIIDENLSVNQAAQLVLAVLPQ